MTCLALYVGILFCIREILCLNLFVTYKICAIMLSGRFTDAEKDCMIATIIIAAATCLGLVLCVLIKPEIGIKKFTLPLYPFIALIGAIAAIAFTPLTIKDCLDGILGAGAVNPLKILTLFISVTAISIFLDEGGFFEYLACKVLKKSGKSKVKLFILLYITVSILTVFTSNDVIILTFTPIILYFCKSGKIKPAPYLVAEFAAANTWSMALIIGNPTNVYIATAAGIDFLGYLKVMILPTLAAGVISLLVLLALFRKSLREPILLPDENISAPMKDKPLCILGLTVLIVCTAGLAVSGYIGIEMWQECAICAAVLIISALLLCLFRRKKPIIVGHALARVPYQLIPFVISMFIIVLALDKMEITKFIASAFSFNELIEYGVGSYLASNLVNNIPMSVLFSSVIVAGNAGRYAVFATVIGSNLGALLSPVGALAGIMFSSITKKAGEKFSNLDFIMYGSCVSVCSLAASLGCLALTLMF